MPLVRCVQGLKHGVFFFPIALSGTTRANLKSQVGAQVRTIGVRFVQSDTQGGQRNPLFDRQCCLGFVFRIAISVFLILLVASSMLGGRRADVLGLHRGLFCSGLAFIWQSVSQHGLVYQNGRIAVCFGIHSFWKKNRARSNPARGWSWSNPVFL